jgi:ubiquinone biosynthesis protein COQ4
MSTSAATLTSSPTDSPRGADGGWMTEREAARIALEGTVRERLATGARALYELIRDTSRTEQVFLLGLVVNGPFFPSLVARITAAPGGLELLAERPSIDSRSVDFDALRALPATTLGGAYARYLDDNKLDPDLFQAPPGLPQVAQTIAQRIRQTHDIWHVLTGYHPDVPGELALQGFTFAQLRMPSALLIATIGTLARARSEVAAVLDGYRRGMETQFLPPVRFEEMWDRDLDDVRRELGVRPAAPRRRRLIQRFRASEALYQ